MTNDKAGRRLLLKTVFAGFTFQAYGQLAEAHYPTLPLPLTDKPITLYNIHTKETLCIDTSQPIENVFETLVKVNHFLRDHRQNAAHAMDVNLLYQLGELQTRLNSEATFEIIAGYRTKSTNELLRRGSKNVAKNSYHLQGRALDLRLQGTQIHLLKDAAVSMQAGGVGYYANSNFIHLDTGPVRYWSA